MLIFQICNCTYTALFDDDAFIMLCIRAGVRSGLIWQNAGTTEIQGQQLSATTVVPRNLDWPACCCHRHPRAR